MIWGWNWYTVVLQKIRTACSFACFILLTNFNSFPNMPNLLFCAKNRMHSCRRHWNLASFNGSDGSYCLWIFLLLAFQSSFQQLAELHISLVFVPRRRYKLSFLYFLAYSWEWLRHGGIRGRKLREKKWVSDLMYNHIVFRSSQILLGTWDDKTKQQHAILIIKIVHVSFCHNMQ